MIIRDFHTHSSVLQVLKESVSQGNSPAVRNMGFTDQFLV